MPLRCTRCHKIVEVFDPHQKPIYIPHKLIGTDIYCDNCIETIEENKHFFKKVKRFLLINNPKVMLTVLIYISMLVYNIVFFKPLSEYNLFAEGFVQFGFIINFPILIFKNQIQVSDISFSILLTLLSVFIVLLWNYLIACILYTIYKKIESA